MNSQKHQARVAGLLYFVYFILFFLADNGVHFTAVGSESFALVAEQIASSEKLFRIGFMSFLLAAVFFLLSAWALYGLLKPVNPDLALLFFALNLSGIAIKCVSLICEFAAMLILSHGNFLSGFNPDQLQALAILFLELYKNGFMIANIFFGLWLLPLGYLVYQSGFLPKILGGLLILDCIAILIWVFQFFFFPGFEMISYLCLTVSLIAEASLCLWLAIKGVNDPKPTVMIEAA
jgi:hypothetical protein